MATPISGPRYAQSYLTQGTADTNATAEIDFDISEGLGVEIMQVQGSFADLDRTGAAAATNEMVAMQSLHLETGIVEDASVLEPDNAEVRTDSEVFWHQYGHVHHLEDNTNNQGGIGIMQSEGLWMPHPDLRPVIVRNITHRLRIDDSALEADAIVRITWRYVRLSNSEQMTILTRRT